MHEGVHSGNIRAQLFVDHQVDKSCRKLLFGRDEIAPYHLTWRGKYIRLAAAPETRSKERYANLGRPEWYEAEKLLVRRTGDYVLAAKDSEGRYASNNFFIVFPKQTCALNLDGLCALLNSGFMTWYFRTIEPRQGRVFAELKIKHLQAFPLPPKIVGRNGCERINRLGRNRTELAETLDHVLTLKDVGRACEELDAEIDETVAEMFRLSDLASLFREQKANCETNR